MYGRMYGHTDSLCILQGFVPLVPSGAAALLPKQLLLQEQGKGTNDHLLPLGDWL